MQINTSNSILEFLNNKKMAIVVEGKGTGTVYWLLSQEWLPT